MALSAFPLCCCHVQDALALEYAAEEWKSEKNMVLASVDGDGRSLEFCAPEYKSDIMVVLKAVRNNGFGARDPRAMEVIRRTGISSIMKIFNGYSTEPIPGQPRWGEELDFKEEKRQKEYKAKRLRQLGARAARRDLGNVLPVSPPHGEQSGGG